MGIFRSDRSLRRTLGFLCLFCFAAINPVSSSPHGTGENITTNFNLLENLSIEVTNVLISNMPVLPDGAIV